GTTSGMPPPVPRGGERLPLPLEHSGSRDRPDDPDVQGDDEQRPERVVRQEQEVREGARDRDHYRDAGRPAAASEQGGPRDRDDDGQDQVDPAPGGHVEAERVVVPDDEERVVQNRRETDDSLEDAG